MEKGGHDSAGAGCKAGVLCTQHVFHHITTSASCPFQIVEKVGGGGHGSGLEVTEWSPRPMAACSWSALLGLPHIQFIK